MAAEGLNQSGWRRLARDVGVNLVANLLAAAVIYVLAVVGGYARTNGLLLPWAVMIIASAVVAPTVGGLYSLIERGGSWRLLWLVLVPVAGAWFALLLVMRPRFW